MAKTKKKKFWSAFLIFRNFQFCTEHFRPGSPSFILLMGTLLIGGACNIVPPQNKYKMPVVSPLSLCDLWQIRNLLNYAKNMKIQVYVLNDCIEYNGNINQYMLDKIPKPWDSRVPRLVNPPPTIPNIYKVVYLNANKNLHSLTQ